MRSPHALNASEKTIVAQKGDTLSLRNPKDKTGE
jgi:hypothetical protein